MMETGPNWADMVSAAASVLAAIATIGIAIIVQRASHRANKVQAMREFSSQWQDYNLAVLSDPKAAAAIVGEYAPGTNAGQVQTMFHIFFRLTNLHQLYFAARHGSVEMEWCDIMIRDMGQLCKHNPALLEEALTGKGYQPAFVDHFRKIADFPAADAPARTAQT